MAKTKKKQAKKKPVQVTPKPVASAVLEHVRGIEAFCDVESIRYALGNIQVDPKRKRIDATDSRTLISVPLAESSGEEPFLINGRRLKELLNMSKRRAVKIEASHDGRRVQLKLHLDDGQTVCAEHRMLEGKFPDVDAVIPDDDAEFAMDIAIDAKFLSRICNHASENCRDGLPAVIRLRFLTPEDVVLVTSFLEETRTVRANYCIMPVHPY